MAEPFIAEVRIWGLNFAPRGWAFCNGQLLPIAQNTALFALIGTIYGGDGRTTTALPNLQGRAAMHPGRGPGLTDRFLGEIGGEPNHTLTLQQIANHSHTLTASGEEGASTDPANNYVGTGNQLFAPANNLTAMAAQSLPNAGGQPNPHENRQPFLALNFCIALQGTFPSRN